MKVPWNLICVGVPLLSGLLLILLAMSSPIWRNHNDRDYLCLAAGLICISLSCVCALLVRMGSASSSEHRGKQT